MLHLLVSLWCKNTFSVGVGGKMNPRIRLTSAKVEVGVEVEAELGNKTLTCMEVYTSH